MSTRPARVAADLRAAWRLPWVRWGTLGCVLFVLGSLTPAYLPQNSPWWPPMRAAHLDGPLGKVGGTVLVLAGLIVLIQAWFKLRPSIYTEVKHWAVLVWWSLPIVAAPPLFSHDAYSYAAQGWLMRNGLNPYEVGPGALPGAFADQSPWVWRFTPTPYGPLSLLIQRGIVDLSGAQPYLAAVLMRVPALIGVALIVLFLPRIAVRMRVSPQFAAWFVVLNPILVTDFVGGAHNDALMTGLVVAAIWLAYRRRPLFACVVLGVAAAIKQPAFLAAYAVAFIWHPLPRLEARAVVAQIGRVLLCCGVCVGTFVAISLASGYDFGWVHAVNVPGSVLTISPFTVAGQGLQLLLNAGGLDPTGHNAIRYSRTVGMLASVAIVGALALTRARREPMSFLAWSYLAVALCGPALHGWYMMWGAALLPLARPSARTVNLAVWASVLLQTYAAINLANRNGTVALVLAIATWLGWVLAHRRRRSGLVAHPPEATLAGVGASATERNADD